MSASRSKMPAFWLREPLLCKGLVLLVKQRRKHFPKAARSGRKRIPELLERQTGQKADCRHQFSDCFFGWQCCAVAHTAPAHAAPADSAHTDRLPCVQGSVLQFYMEKFKVSDEVVDFHIEIFIGPVDAPAELIFLLTSWHYAASFLCLPYFRHSRITCSHSSISIMPMWVSCSFR